MTETKWNRVKAGFYRMSDSQDDPCGFVERADDGTWDWWLAARVTSPAPPAPVAKTRTLAEAKKGVEQHYELAVSLPGIISSGVQRIMADATVPVEVRAKEAVAWIASWVRVEVSVLR